MRTGDFTGRLELEPRRRIRRAGAGLQPHGRRAGRLVGQVQKSGIQVNTSVTEIAATAKEQQATASEIAATTTEIGATSKEISATSQGAGQHHERGVRRSPSSRRCSPAAGRPA